MKEKVIQPSKGLQLVSTVTLLATLVNTLMLTKLLRKQRLVEKNTQNPAQEPKQRKMQKKETVDLQDFELFESVNQAGPRSIDVFF